MKILHVIPSLKIGGAEKIVANLSSALADKGYDVSVLLFSPITEDCFQVSKRVKVKTISSRLTFKYNIVSMLRVLWYLKKEKFDVVHTHLTVNNTFVRLIAVLAGIRVIVGHEHGGFLVRNGAARFILKMLEKRISYNIYISEHDLKYFTAYDKVRTTDKNIVINNPLLLNAKPYMLRPNKRVKRIGMVGRIIECKGHIWALKAISSYLRENDCSVMIVGDGSENIKQEIQRIGIESGIDIKITGYTQNVEHYLEGFDMLIHPSLSEGFGMAIIEAMAFGIPVVASKVGGIPNIIKNNYNGLLVEPMNSAELLNQVKRLFNDSLLRESISQNAFDSVEKFSFHNYITTIENVYERSFYNNHNS